MSFTQPNLTVSQQTEIAAYINALRAKHQAPPLVWDNSIYPVSQQWSFYLSSNNLFQHSANNLYGENLAYFQGYGSDPMVLIKLSIDSWYNEVLKYDFNSPGFSSATGHFTCLVWKSSTNFAMGITMNDSNTSAVITMNTSPAGNIEGQFQQNVLPIMVPLPNPEPIPSPIPSPTPIPSPSPSPSPTPIPSPEPIPVPSPNPSPINISMTVISALHNIVYMMNSKQNKYTIIYALNSIINTYSPYLSKPIIDSLYNLIRLFQVGSSRMTIVRAINSIILNLQS